MLGKPKGVGQAKYGTFYCQKKCKKKENKGTLPIPGIVELGSTVGWYQPFFVLFPDSVTDAVMHTLVGRSILVVSIEQSRKLMSLT